MTRSSPRFTGPLPTARSLALEVLLECRQGNSFIQEVLDRRLGQGDLSAADRRLAAHLAYGVLRRRGTLDALLRPLLTRQPHQIEPWLWDALRLGAFQLAFLTHVPSHAALNETVELAALFSRPGAKGFLNGVLRSLSKILTADPAEGPASNALPLEKGRYHRLDKAVLPDPNTHPVEYLARAFALPSWLTARWAERYSWQECLRLGFWFAGPAPLWLRCNTLRTDREAFLASLHQSGLTAVAGHRPQAVCLTESAAIREIPGYVQGWFTVQDESAMAVAGALDPAPGSRVLDLCAAPGGKTTHLAEFMKNQGQILACDVDDRRLQTLASLCRRLGITVVETRRLHPERNEEPPPGPFDAALVDVPCSNTGVLCRRPEVRWRLRPEDFARLVPLQTRLLVQAGMRIRPGGTIVYSTCSIEPEENQQVVRAVLQALPNLMLEGEEVQVPGQPADGGYWARLRRKEE